MDSLTHIAVGACVGEAFFERGFGKKALFWGALAQSIPDIDFISGFWLDTSEQLLAHRGFTHSILFGLLIVPAFAMTADRVHRPHDILFKKWLLFFGVEVFLHLLLDVFNNYGVGWFEPFSHQRFSFNAIYVADAFFSIWPGIAFVVLLVLKRYHPARRFWWKFGLFLPLIYLAYCTYNKVNIDKDVRTILKSQNIAYDRYFTTPAPLQNWLWFVVAGNDSGYHVGFRSVFDSKKEISFQYFAKNDTLLAPTKDQPEVQRLIRFSQQFYTVEQWNDTLVFNDLRFGQITGWVDPREKFVFHFYLKEGADNRLVVQRGRFAKWDWNVVKAFYRRIKGN
ncbi:MAG: metal-dependent hydrolase [Bacteroidetes bacterium]|jgi:inner membrane protein|nr:MAG: metal-dependent hydrolase [Bacteroidota bacterium]